MTSLLATAALAVLAASSALTRLQATDGGEVVLSGASHFRSILRERRTEFTGEPVKLVRGDGTLTCKKLSVQQNDKGEFESARCEGDVRFVRGDRTITCERAIYDDPAARLTADGSPEFREGKTLLSGSHLVYDLARDEIIGLDITGHTDAGAVDTQLKRAGSRANDGAKGGAKGAEEKKP